MAKKSESRGSQPLMLPEQPHSCKKLAFFSRRESRVVIQLELLVYHMKPGYTGREQCLLFHRWAGSIEFLRITKFKKFNPNTRKMAYSDKPD